VDLGITYIDTSYDYSGGISERRIGKVLKARGRKRVFVAAGLNSATPAYSGTR
jgi:aryl-alcohol dehydrogenase-like predicted oxidoreductase